MDFMREFPDDATCLDYLWRTRCSPDGEHAYCPHCDLERHFRRYHAPESGKTRVRQVWTCTSCSHQLSPTAGTIFHKSSTSLHLWFYAIWLITSTRCGVSAKQFERELGVTYKTAWRMFNEIRNKLMTQDEGPLSGEVEADETWIGGKMRESERRRKVEQGEAVVQIGPHAKKREVVFATVERGGRVVAMHLPSRYGYTLRKNLVQTVKAGSTVYTDDYSGYNGLNYSYRHHTINHSERDLRERARPHADRRGVLLARQERHPRRLPLGLPQVARVVPERVCVAVQPPRRPRGDVPATDRARSDQLGQVGIYRTVVDCQNGVLGRPRA